MPTIPVSHTTTLSSRPLSRPLLTRIPRKPPAPLNYHQNLSACEKCGLAKRYVVRGLESGGAAGDVGRYVTFTQADGQPVEYLHPVEAIGVNGLHAVVVSPVLVRVEMLRTGRTFELLITQHRPGATNDGKRPPLETRLLFRGIHGRLNLDLSERDKDKAGTVLPTFYSRAGEEVRIPKRFRQSVRAITAAVHCDGCFHCHYVRPPQNEEEQVCAAERVTA